MAIEGTPNRGEIWKLKSNGRIWLFKSNGQNSGHLTEHDGAYCLDCNGDEYFSEYVSYCAKKEMDKSLSKLNSKSKFISVKYTPSKIKEPQIPSLSSKEFTIISCKCDKNIKVEDSIEVLHYCPYCKEII